MKKKVTLYFVRHGETEFNLLHKTQGWCDSPLSEGGVKQVEGLARGLQSIPFQKVYSSDLGRAIQTAKILIHDRPLELISEYGLREHGFGDTEGGSEEGFTREDYIKRATLEFCQEHGAETREQVYERMKKVIDQIVEDAKDGDSILVVVHGVCLGDYLFHFLKKDFTTMMEEYRAGKSEYGPLGNCSVTIVQYEDGQPTIQAWGDTSYIQ